MASHQRKRGDRHDAARVRDVDALHNIMPHLMKNRTESEVYTTLHLDVTEVLRMIEERNASDDRRTTFFHTVLTAVAKTIHQRPKLNMYISGKRYYMRHKISMAFIAKKNFSDGSKESVIFLEPEGDWNLDKVRDTVLDEVDRSRNESCYGLDSTLNVFKKLPRCVTMVVFKVLRFLDFYNMMPASLMEGDSNYSTVLLTNLGSLKGPAVYHHLNDYGTNSFVISIGTIRKENRLMSDGSVEVRDMVDVGVTIDERIADGAYFIRSLNLLKYILEHPDVLNTPLTEEVDYEQ